MSRKSGHHPESPSESIFRKRRSSTRGTLSAVEGRYLLRAEIAFKVGKRELSLDKVSPGSRLDVDAILLHSRFRKSAGPPSLKSASSREEKAPMRQRDGNKKGSHYDWSQRPTTTQQREIAVAHRRDAAAGANKKKEEKKKKRHHLLRSRKSLFLLSLKVLHRWP